MHQTLTYQVKQNLLFRVLPLFFAAIMLLSGAPVMVQFFREQLQELVSDAPKKEPPLSEHALGVTLDGSAAGSFVLQSYEKKTLTAANLKGKATYQWQIRHPEKDVWINIYDATDKELPVSAALVKNMLNAQGNASLRCRAYTKDYTYLSNAISVKLADLGSSAPNTGDSGSTDGAGSGAPLGSGSPVADDGDEGEKEFVTITIEYELFGYVKQSDGTMKEVSLGQAFTSYVAMLQYGSSLEAANGKIHSPDIVGFKPKLVAGYDSDGKSVLTVKENDAQGNPIYNEEILETNGDHFVNIAQNEVTKDITYEVQYHPAKVDYEVRYFFQNVYDDLYVEDGTILDKDDNPAVTIRTKGETSSEPPVEYTKRVFPGFTSLYYQPEAIAADGSTVFQVFFERDYYLMEFDCNGGYGADTIYVRYGTYISVPNPVRSGYEFAGWNEGHIQYDVNGQPLTDSEGRAIVEYEQEFDPDHPETFTGATLPSTMGSKNTIYRAEWKRVKTTYTVAYWREKVDGSGYEFWGNAVIGLDNNGQPDGSVLSGTYVSGSETPLTNSLALCGKRPHVHGASCTYSCGYTVHTHGDGNCVYCGETEHTHTYVEDTGCCSLYHVHSAECGYACGKEEHTAHQRSCYTFTGGTVSSNASTPYNPSLYRTYDGLAVYRTTSWGSSTYYVLIDGRYYQIANFNYNNFRGTLSSQNCPNVDLHQHSETCGYACGKMAHTHVATDAEACNLVSCSNGGVEHIHGAACCTKIEHTHTGCTLSCGLTPHTHTTACYTRRFLFCSTNHTHIDSCYSTFAEDDLYTFERADSNVMVQGDGSTVVNVYYTPKEYTLRFYYARTSNSGGTVYVATNTGSGYNRALNGESQITSGNINWNGNTNSRTLPSLTNNKCTSGSVTIGSRQYYYLDLTAKYGANIEDVWPAAVVGKSGNYSFGSWGAENGSGYRKLYGNAHANIVGPYPYMSAELIVDPNADASSGNIAHNFVAWWGGTGDNVSAHAYHIYYEALPNQTADTIYDGKRYVLDRTAVFTAAHNDTTRVDPFVYNGYTIIPSQKNGFPDSRADEFHHVNCSLDPKASAHDYCNNFYYTRNEHTLSFHNYNDASTSLPSQTLKYDQPFSGLTMPGTPPYPTGIEPRAYEFVAWYTTPVFDEKTKVTEEMWQSMKMPDGDVALYAKWVPIQRKVTFYYLYTDLGTDKTWTPVDQDGNAVPIEYPILVEHGSLLGTTYSYIPQRDGYDFVGWFYMDQDNKKKFAPDSMEIRRDLHLFAEWHSKTDTTYEITYTLAEDVTIGKTTYSAGTVVGEPTIGHASAGKTKTFTAKDRGQLNSPFNSDEMSLFPTLNSHSILMSENSADNTFNFTYVYDAEVFYKIRYVDKTTNVDLRKPEVFSTNMAIVTAKFLPIPEYIPEQYYIRKVLASDDAYGGSEDNVLPANEIIFYYIPDSEHALYTIEYYKETLEDGVYELVQSAVGSDKLGQNIQVSIDANKYNGFTYGYTTVTKYDQNPSGEMNTVNTKPDASGKVDISAPLTVHGVEIRVYYTRNSYPYVIKFMQTGTTDVLGYGLLNPDGTVMMKDGSPVFTLDEINAAKPMEKFEYTISYTPAGSFKIGENEYRLDGYDPEHPENSAKSLKIRQETGDYEDLVDNDLVFWYSQRQVTVYYQAVCTVPGATQFGGVTFSRETQPVATLLAGSAATPGNGYKFLGWFDELGNQVTEDGWVTETPAGSGTYHLKPKAFNDHNNDDEVYYYARFAPISASLVIENEVDAGSCMHNFVIRLQGQGKLEYVDLTFVITGTGSVTIEEAPVGSYSVTKTLWGWEHTPKTETVNVTVAVDTENRVTFQNICTDSNWLEGEAKR